MAPPQTQKENAKPNFHFDFNSPDLRARSNKMESIYSDSSDDETPKRARHVFPSNPTTFAAFLKPNGGSIPGQSTGGFGGLPVKKEEAANGGMMSRDVSVPNKGFGLFSKPTQGENNSSSAAATDGFGGFGAASATSTLFKPASPRAALIPGIETPTPPGSQSLSLFGAATQPQSTQSTSAFSGPSIPAPAKPSLLFQATTSTPAQVAAVSAFQNRTHQVSQSLSPVGPVAQSSSAPVPASAVPFSFLTAATTTTAQVASVSLPKNNSSQVTQSSSLFGFGTPTPAVTIPKNNSSQVTQSTSLFGLTTKSAGTPTPAATIQSSSLSGITTPTPPAAIPKNNSSQVTQSSSPFGNLTPAATIPNNSSHVTQSSSLFEITTKSAVTPTLAATISESNMAQAEEARLFAAHVKLLDVGTSSQDQHEITGTPLFTKKVLDHSKNLFSQYGFLAGISDVLESNAAADLNIDGPSRPADPRLFFNISAPSSASICGSQGSGKSHTLSCLLENCLMKSDVSKLDSPLAGLVSHYDSFTSDVKGTPCEAAHISSNSNVKVRVLVSPTNLETMKRTYAGLNVTVEPLQINQTDLNTKRMLELMCVNENEGRMPLYLHTVTRILREMRLLQQTKNTGFNYAEFKRLVSLCDMTREQLMPLHQRLDTLESFMPHSQRSANAQPKKGKGKDSYGSDWSVQAGTLTLVDLSCPCVTAESACSLFNMCLSLFLEQHTTVGRVIGLDEAHKYMSAGAEAGTLTNTLLSSIRLQRHLGTRVFISTQEPTISPKLLDLCSITIVHRFSSPDWLRELRSHLAALDNDEEDPGKSKFKLINIFNQIVKLRTGEALLFAPSAILGVEKKQTENGSEETQMKRLGTGCLKIKIRARVTSDGGRSVFALGGSQAGSAGAGASKPATSAFQSPLTSVAQAASVSTQSAAFGTPSPAKNNSNRFNTTYFPAAVHNSGFGRPIDSFKSTERTKIIGGFTTSSPSTLNIFSYSSWPALGTRSVQFQPFIEKEPNSTTGQQNSFQNIGFQLPYQKHSQEELRFSDYAVGVRYWENYPRSMGFGSSSGR